MKANQPIRRKFFRLPRRSGRSHAAAKTDTSGTTLGQEVCRYCAADPELSGVRLLRDGKNAFAARVLLARAAERTLDVQYYIWHDDLSGSLMLDEIEAAADRGVHVRLLLDDNGIPRLDRRLAALNLHASIEIRLYNPFAVRRPKSINWLFDFRRLNHRMHAKSFTVDNQVTIVGGRNIGDAYFAARDDGLFVDLDVLAIGPVVSEVSDAFDRCWNGPLAYPMENIVAPPSRRTRQKLARRAAALARSEKAQGYLEAVRAQPLFNQLANGEVELTWARAQIAESVPAPAAIGASMSIGLNQLLPAGMATPASELNIISGYFVPGEKGMHDLCAMAQKGTRVRVLTNCYAATDIGFVHAGYAPCRHALLSSGVELFEIPAPGDKPRTARKFVRPGSRFARRARALAGTLHAKAFAVDRRQIYVGSANFDPRSACINTELGLVIESEELASAMSDLFEEEVASNTYRLGLGNNGRIQWIDERDDRPEPEFTEPGSSRFSRTLVRLLSRLGLEWLI